MADLEMKKVAGQGFTFQKIFEIYDAQFETLRDFLVSLGDTFEVESFTGSTNKKITTNHEVAAGTTFVYKNNIILWLGEGYTITGKKGITLSARASTDVIKVVIADTTLFKSGITEYLDSVRTMAGSVEETYIKARNLYNAFEELFQRLDLKIVDYNREKDAVEDAIAELKTIHDWMVRTQTYYDAVVAMTRVVETASGLRDERVAYAEIIEARNGAGTLHQRLEKMCYHFNSTDDMQAAIYLQKGDQAIIQSPVGNLDVYIVSETDDPDKQEMTSYRLLSVSGLSAFRFISCQNAAVQVPVQILKCTDNLFFEEGTKAMEIRVDWEANIVPTKADLAGSVTYPENYKGTSRVWLSGNAAITSDSSFTLALYGADGSIATREIKALFRPKIYLGVVGESFDFLKDYAGLSTCLLEDKDIVVSGSLGDSKYMFLAMPEKLTPEFWIDGICGGFEKLKTIKFKEQDISLYRTVNSGLGDLKVRVNFDAEAASIVWQFLYI